MYTGHGDGVGGDNVVDGVGNGDAYGDVYGHGGSGDAERCTVFCS